MTQRELCPSNAGGSDVFWANVRMTVHIASAQIDHTTNIDTDKLENMVLREWLAFMSEAGTA